MLNRLFNNTDIFDRTFTKVTVAHGLIPYTCTPTGALTFCHHVHAYIYSTVAVGFRYPQACQGISFNANATY